MNHFEKISIESISKDSLQEALAFLQKHEDFSLFLLGNLEAHGHQLGSAPNSGNFKIARRKGNIIAIFCLTKRGNLLIQSETSDPLLMEEIRLACQKEALPILGLLGPWDVCKHLWNLLKEKTIILHETFISKEILYTADLSQQKTLNEPNVRFLLPDDYPQWRSMRLEYLKEKGLPNDLSKDQDHELFLEKVNNHISWGCFLGGQLTAMADLNAKAKDLGQVGGVYTHPTHRKKGFARSIMHQLMTDARNRHQIRKLIIFTGENNLPARKLYESLGVHPVGYYALMFGTSL